MTSADTYLQKVYYGSIKNLLHSHFNEIMGHNRHNTVSEPGKIQVRNIVRNKHMSESPRLQGQFKPVCKPLWAVRVNSLNRFRNRS